VKFQNLKTGAIPPVSTDMIYKVNSTKYSYSVWIYVNNFSIQRKNSSLFSFESPGGKPIFRLFFDDENPNYLKAEISGLKLSDGTNIMTITPNFTLQRWTNVAVSVDTYMVNCYIDGKFLKSTPMSYLATIDTSSIIRFGNNQDILLANIIRWHYSIDPQAAYYAYLQGNGQSSNAFSIIPTIGENAVATIYDSNKNNAENAYDYSKNAYDYSKNAYDSNKNNAENAYDYSKNAYDSNKNNAENAYDYSKNAYDYSKNAYDSNKNNAENAYNSRK
jgi:hypothetical protein